MTASTSRLAAGTIVVPRRARPVAHIALAILGLLTPASASLDGLRGSRPLVGATWVGTGDLKRSLNEVLHDAIGGEKAARLATDVSIDRMKSALRPLYATLPKNSRGLLDHSTVRYALHRFFAHQRAMRIKGLDSAGDVWNSSSPAKILQDQVPAYLQELIEERLDHGFDLYELAIFAATLEHIIHQDAVEKLKTAYRMQGLNIGVGISEAQLHTTLDLYMLLTRKRSAESLVSPSRVDALLASVGSKIPEWASMQTFAREMEESVLGETANVERQQDSFSFANATAVTKAIVDQFGRSQDRECRGMESLLGYLEDPDTGRIDLENFYRSGQNFVESKEYLQQLGALDVSNPSTPRVIIPNYMMSITNCYESSSLYHTCCINQCEELLGHLERHLATPEALPSQIVELVKVLPSATTTVPRELPAQLLRRLDDTAAEHGGRVPLHGRLFAQWMHHAYPRECPYPHLAGTTRPQTPEEWRGETGEQATLSRVQISRAIEGPFVGPKVKDLLDRDLNEDLPWLEGEELVSRHVRPPSLARELFVLLRGLALVTGLFSVALSFSKVFGSALSSTHDDQSMKLRV